MMTDLQRLTCGACGCESFAMYRHQPTRNLVAECRKCRSTSIITVGQPQIVIDWGEGAEGVLAPSS